MFRSQEQPTESKFISMSELAKEFKAQTLSNREGSHTVTTEAGLLSIICES